MSKPDEPTRCVHYVGFRDGYRFFLAKRMFGGPVFIHQKFDKRMRQDVGPNDLVVFAEGDEFQRVHTHNGSDVSDDY